MALDVFGPIHNPAPASTQMVAKRRVNTAQFGDGYSQRSGDGLNVAPRTFTVQWDSILSTEADTYEAFFDAHAVTPFLWTAPLDSIQRKWIAGDATRGFLGGSVVSLSCPLTEVFDL